MVVSVNTARPVRFPWLGASPDLGTEVRERLLDEIANVPVISDPRYRRPIAVVHSGEAMDPLPPRVWTGTQVTVWREGGHG